MTSTAAAEQRQIACITAVTQKSVYAYTAGTMYNREEQCRSGKNHIYIQIREEQGTARMSRALCWGFQNGLQLTEPLLCTKQSGHMQLCPETQVNFRTRAQDLPEHGSGHI